jgi:hypothetical protein
MVEDAVWPRRVSHHHKIRSFPEHLPLTAVNRVCTPRSPGAMTPNGVSQIRTSDRHRMRSLSTSGQPRLSVLIQSKATPDRFLLCNREQCRVPVRSTLKHLTKSPLL